MTQQSISDYVFSKDKVWSEISTPLRMFTVAPTDKAIKGQFALYEIQIKQK